MYTKKQRFEIFPFFAAFAVALIIRPAAILADNRGWKCLPNTHYSQAEHMLQEGREKSKLGQYYEAAKALKTGLNALDYTIGEYNDLDDSGQILAAAAMYDRNRDFKNAALLRERIFEGALRAF